jgi:hypothetical protein
LAQPDLGPQVVDLKQRRHEATFPTGAAVAEPGTEAPIDSIEQVRARWLGSHRASRTHCLSGDDPKQRTSGRVSMVRTICHNFLSMSARRELATR